MTTDTIQILRPAGAPIHPAPESFVKKYVFSIDHKVIGIQYFITAGLMMLLSGLFAEAIRIQLLQPHNTFLTAQQFDEAFTFHGTLMVWFGAIPMITGGFGNFAMPLQIGARDVAFPWLNMFSFWTFPPAVLILLSSLAFGAPNAGWTEYPPVSLQAGVGIVFWTVAIFTVGIGATLTGLNFLTTIIKMRAPGMTFTRMPLFVWATGVTSFLSLVATTALASALGSLFLSHVFNVPFYDPARGGTVVLFQHMFWFYSHPAVYIMILPIFGVVSEIIPTFARKPIFGYKLIAYSSVSIGLLSFMVWAHHMFTSGLGPWVTLPFMILTMLIAVPTGVKIFSWVATLFGSRMRLTTPMLFTLGFLSTFTLGGITGVMLASVPVDWHEHATYFLVAHIHYVLFGGTVMGALGAIYYWWPKVTGRMMSETLGKWHFWLTFILFNTTFLPMHFVGLLGMPRRVAYYDPAFQGLNVFISISAFCLGVSFLLLIVNMFWSKRSGPVAGPNPWGARTLEWMIPSPPPYYNFREVPEVYAHPYSYGEPLPYSAPYNQVSTTPTY